MKGELTKVPEPISNELNLKEKVANFSNKISFGGGSDKSVATIALLATLVAATIVLILWTSARNYVPLYGNQESYDKANILEILDTEEITFRIDTDSGNILVPQEKLADARITLAARGIKASMPEGMENISDKVSMGTSQFIESMQYQHALEGELARTIINMQGVRNARVHLAVPKRSLFVGRTEQKTAASVMVDLAPGHELKPEQVEAVIALVIGSVPGLDSKSVSVVDQRGKLLSGDLFGDSSPVGKETDKKLAFTEKVERNIEQRASIMLLPILGEGNFRIQVSTDVDFSVVEETKEFVDPQNVLKQEFVKSDSTTDQFAAGIPGSLANEPPLPNDEGADNNNDRTTERSETKREFENGRSVTHTQYEVGRVKSMSLSVLVNQGATVDEAGWNQERLASLGEMVKKATGFSDERGDQFNITSFTFVEAKLLAPGEGLEWWQMPEFREYARYIFGTLISLLLILFGVRPLVNHLIKGKSDSTALVSDADKKLNEEDALDRQSTPLDDAINANAEIDKIHAEASERNSLNIALPQIGNDFEKQIGHMQLLASKETERVTSVIKYWVEEGVEIESRKA